MRDERAGSYAVIGAILYIMLKYFALFSLPLHAPALLLTPMLGRACMTQAIYIFPYARAEGLGRDMKDNTSWFHAAVAGCFAAIVAAWIGDWHGLAAFGIALVFALLVAWFVVHRLHGLTGDVYGALCELTELATLLVFVAGDRL
jgi:adenosylcobinamide-GDP ribazoletransferase